MIRLAQRPSQRDAVQRAERGARHEVRCDVLAELAAGLPGLDDLGDDVQVGRELGRGILLQQLRGLPENDGHDLGQLVLVLEEAQLKLDDPAQALLGRAQLGELVACVREELLDPVLEERHEERLLRHEVEVDGAVGDPGGSGHVADARGVEAVLGEDPDRRVEDPLALVPAGTTRRWNRAFLRGSRGLLATE